jgi:hypothetical protein
MHEEFLELAEELIPENGREVTFIQLSTASGGFPGEGPGDPRNPPARAVTVVGCFVEPDSLQRLGLTTKIEQLLQTSDRICLIPGTENLRGYDEVIDSDDGRYYKIQGMEELKPGTRSLLYFVGVER